ncbi:anhydro-N-acetylmuramic acid kinase AnmK [Clostridium sp.]|uniref:anhydro-N-acetylmuramic acid kinase AnmK n=1 Tax=Clostridium sp. TaxID=1506 RepID=UPI003D6C8567
MFAVGLMSGTSLDGIDAALVQINGNYTGTVINLIGYVNMKMPEDIKDEIKVACSIEDSSSILICSLNFKLGYLFSDAVKAVCKKYDFPMERLDFIASHGQTIFHIPKAHHTFMSSTLQIGEPSVIAYETNTTVISNFRVMDMAAGGQGAPLVSYSEFILYRSPDKNRLLQNIGGVGNVTVIPKNADINDVIAFDTGPGNMIIDEICEKLFKVKYDFNGDIARSGEVDKGMLNDLMSHPFLIKSPPKTTGREEFGKQFTEDILRKYRNLSSETIIATATVFTAKSIAHSYKTYIFPKLDIDEMIISGGGAYNSYLVELIKGELPQISVLTQEDLGYSSDAKEAIAFAILGNETLNNSFSNIPTATGAKAKVILGNITPIGKSSLEMQRK